jgi:hypothetical protein
VAVVRRDASVSPLTASLVAVEGVDGAAVEAAAREVLGRAGGRRRGGISRWDASGIFRELAFAGPDAGQPAARTLLLLYAADLAFRVRWEIRPALADGRLVVVAPYTETAIAFGLAFGLRRKWLAALFRGAPRPSRSEYVGSSLRAVKPERVSFIEFSSNSVRPQGLTHEQIVNRAREYLQTAARRNSGRRAAAPNTRLQAV